MKRYIKMSTAIHAVLLLGISIYPFFLLRRYKYNMRPAQTLEFINLSEPEIPKPEVKPKAQKKEEPKKKEEKKTVKPPPKPKSNPKAKTVVPPLKSPDLEKKLAEKLKNFTEPSEAKQENPKEENVQHAPRLTSAITTSTSNFPFQWYLDFIQGKIDSCWNQPQMAIAKQYATMVSFTILKEGQIRNIHIKRPSGITTFDDSAMQAIEKALPMPPLPEGYNYTELTINVEFKLE